MRGEAFPRTGEGDGGREGGSGRGERVRGQEAIGGARKMGAGFLGAVVLLDIKEGWGHPVLLLLGGPWPGGRVTAHEGMGQVSRASSRPSGSDRRGGQGVLGQREGPAGVSEERARLLRDGQHFLFPFSLSFFFLLTFTLTRTVHYN